MPQVKILADQVIMTHPDLTRVVPMRLIQYQIDDAPVRTLMLPEDQYRPQDLPRLIREDLEKAKTQGPRSIEI